MATKTEGRYLLSVAAQRKARLPRVTGQSHSHWSGALRDLIEKSGDAADTSIADDGEIRALDRAVGALRAKSPGEADVVAKAVGLADQLEPEIRKALLHSGDQSVDAVMAVAAHQRVDIFRIFGPMLAKHLAPAARRAFVPKIDIAAGNRSDVGHLLSPSILAGLIGRPTIEGWRAPIDYLAG